MRRLDDRVLALGGEPTWIRTGLEPWTNGYNTKMHDWINLISSAGDYIFSDVYPGHEQRRRQELLHALQSLFSELLSLSSEHGDPRDAVDRTKLKVAETLCMAEAVLPLTEMTAIFHILLHVPDAIYRWNSVRNFWCFFGERYLY